MSGQKRPFLGYLLRILTIMLYHLAQYLTPFCGAFNVVHYVSFRAPAAFITTMLISWCAGDWCIAFARRHFRARAREWTPEHHKKKDNLPTMGGVFIVGLVVCNTLLWSNLADPRVWVMIFGLIGFGAIGVWDDLYKVWYRKGISARSKFMMQVVVSLLTVAFWLYSTGVSWTITIPFFKNIYPDLGWFFIPWALFIIIGCSNAVNLTDGLDGLAMGSLIPNFSTFSALCYLAGSYKIASYLAIPFADTGEVAVIGVILVAASLGFLWYNAYPAQIFMGDVGSLSLGAGLALMALLCKQEILLAVAGGVFVAETLSVILQVGSYKLRGKRLFRMAPMHHHFELLGWPEAQITMKFAIISLVLCMMALLTIKIR